jgi:hypothetical protein
MIRNQRSLCYRWMLWLSFVSEQVDRFKLQHIPVLRDNGCIIESFASLNVDVSGLRGTSAVAVDGRDSSRVPVIFPHRGYSVSSSDMAGDGGESANSMNPAKYSSR